MTAERSTSSHSSTSRVACYGCDECRFCLERYGLHLVPPVLDIGCSNGAFVDACKAAGIPAEGYDIDGTAAQHRSLGKLRGGYGTVTMHDVLEHVIDPVYLLREARRLVETLIIDAPDFFGPDGAHHWKPIEHLWMFTRGQLLKWLEHTGFMWDHEDCPVPGKIVVCAT